MPVTVLTRWPVRRPAFPDRSMARQDAQACGYQRRRRFFATALAMESSL